MGDAETPSPTNWQKRRSTYQEKALQVAILGIPLGLLGKLNEYLIARVVQQPYEAIWFLIPVGLAVWVLRRGIARREKFHLDKRLLLFLGVYILLFSAAAQASFLDWSRDLTMFGKPAARSWLTPVSWGDWRYRFVPKESNSDELVIVLIKPLDGRRLEETRKDLTDVIALAVHNKSDGIALDVYFDGESKIDPLLCHMISNAGIPVFAGYGFRRIQGRIVELRVPETLSPCLTRERQVHLAGFRDIDDVCRITPLFFRNRSDRPALALAVARSLSGQAAALELPTDGLLRFVEPEGEYPIFRLEELQRSAEAREVLNGRFVMVGEESQRDTFVTPFGPKPGVVIHADVVHSLRQSHFIRPHPWWFGLALTTAFCYWLTVWCANGASAPRLSLLCGGATVFITMIALAGILTGPFWIDVVYPVVAIWLLLPLLVGLRRTIPRAGSLVSARLEASDEPASGA